MELSNIVSDLPETEKSKMIKYVGCSGYYYDHWKGLFYPDDLPKKDWLDVHSGNFLGNQKININKLELFCRNLDTSVPHVFEFRHNSWFTQEVFDLLKSYKCSICMLSAPGDFPDKAFTVSDIAYIRFHGKNGWYNDNYSEEQLNQWTENSCLYV